MRATEIFYPLDNNTPRQNIKQQRDTIKKKTIKKIK